MTEPQQRPIKTWEPSGLFELGTEHGCLTGDCPHERGNECDADIRRYIAELCNEGQRLQERVERLEGHLNWVGWSSEGVERAMRATATLAQQNKSLADERDQLREMINREIRRRRYAERQVDRGNQLLNQFDLLVDAICEDPLQWLTTRRAIDEANPWTKQRLTLFESVTPDHPGPGRRAGL